MDLVPLKVKIGLREKGFAKYPDFNSLPLSVRGDMDWAEYIDAYGSGWLYDDCGHKEEEIRGDEWDSPIGQQWGVILVPKPFADAAILAFPNEVEKMDQTRTETFYNNYHARKQPENIVDEEALKPFETKVKLGVPLTTKEQLDMNKALDPNDPTLGVTKNLRKTWADFKVLKGIKIVQ